MDRLFLARALVVAGGLVLAPVALCKPPSPAQAVFALGVQKVNAARVDPAVTRDLLDTANTTEFPRAEGPKGSYRIAPTREEGLLRTLRILTPPTPHDEWRTGETTETTRRFRIAFTQPVPVGTVLLGGMSPGFAGLSYLRENAPYPGDVEADAQWVSVPTTPGQAGLTVVTLPPNVRTRALRLTFQSAPAPGARSSSAVGGVRILAPRLHNLTPEATAVASSEPKGTPREIEAARAANLVRGGTWRAAPTVDVSAKNPQWVVLSWPQAKTLHAIGFADAFAKRIEVDALLPAARGNPAAAPDSAWSPAGALDVPVWWRPALHDPLVALDKPVTTRALRIRITAPLTNEDTDIARVTAGARRTVRLGGVLALTDLGDDPVPPRPRPVEDPAPIAIRFTMPYAGRAAMVIEDAKGHRVRNLFAEEERGAGARIARWDGLDDAGTPMPPGTYTWKMITHRPLHLAYQATVNVSGDPPWWKSSTWDGQAGAGSWLSDHAPPNDVTAIGDRVFIGAQIAESGHTLLACDLNGKKLWGTKWLETAGAGFLTNDGRKVYSLGEGGWIGDRLLVHEIDPQTFAWRRVTQLVFSPSVTGKASGIAARDGKLYIAFNAPRPSWLRSSVGADDLDAASTTGVTFGADRLPGFLRIAGDAPAHGEMATPKTTEPEQHLRLAFRDAQAVGTVLTSADVEVSALRPDAPYPGDLTNDAQWAAFSPVNAAQGGMRAYTAPPSTVTRALRFTFHPTGMAREWQGRLGAVLVTRARFDNVSPPTLRPGVGAISADGWEVRRDRIITPRDPATLIAAWDAPRTFRALAFTGLAAKRVAVDAYSGSADPATAPEAEWTNVGEVTPRIRWRAALNDDYLDLGRDVTATAVRLRVLEPWIAENADIAGRTGGKANYAALGSLVALRAAGGDPPSDAPPAQRISVVDIASGKWERHLEVTTPRFPHFDVAGRLVCVSDTQVVRVDTSTGATTPLVSTGLTDPRGIAFDRAGNLYVADGGPEQIRVFTADGKPLRAIGESGGRQVGAYDTRRIENPQGIAVDAQGQLWVAESDYQPKRTSVWTAQGTFVRELIGPAQYGGGGFLDPQDKRRFYYNGVEYSIDWTTGAWKVQNVLVRTRVDGREPASAAGPMDHPVYLNGRQYMVNDPGAGFEQGSLLQIGEFRKDRIVPRAAVGNADAWPAFTRDSRLPRLVEGKPLNRYAFAWVDRNGDGEAQAEEVELGPEGVRLDPTYWPSRVSGRLEVLLGKRLLQPESFTASGAPIYKPFAATPLSIPSENVYASAIDALGRVLINGRPVVALRPDSTVAWTYPQRWVGVHDSHTAPAPQPGQMVGALGFIGQETVPGLGESFMLSGNMGEWYLFSPDGILAATVWKDFRTPGVNTWHFPEARRGMSLDGVTLGEEHFGGGFVRTSDGRYYLIAGHNHNSLVELTGLETMRRQQGVVTITTKDVAASEAWRLRRAVALAETSVPKVIDVATVPANLRLDGSLAEWPDALFTPIGGRGAFAVAQDEQNLYVAFRVDSGGDLRNAGADPNLLFKTGDSVDIQIAADPAADPKRTAPAPGDQRILITRLQGQPIGVLYRHRVPGTRQAERTGFSSPWRTEYVDRIERLPADSVGIARTARGYAVEVRLPLALLGIAPRPGLSLRADFGILSADSSGGATQARTYWANPATTIVSDVPSEIALTPGLWGEIRLR